MGRKGSPFPIASIATRLPLDPAIIMVFMVNCGQRHPMTMGIRQVDHQLSIMGIKVLKLEFTRRDIREAA